MEIVMRLEKEGRVRVEILETKRVVSKQVENHHVNRHETKTKKSSAVLDGDLGRGGGLDYA